MFGQNDNSCVCRYHGVEVNVGGIVARGSLLNRYLREDKGRERLSELVGSGMGAEREQGGAGNRERRFVQSEDILTLFVVTLSHAVRKRL